MSDATDMPTDASAPDEPQPHRSTQGVVLVLALLLLIPILALVFAFWPGGSSDGAGASVVDAVDTDQVQAVYMTNDSVYFGLIDDSAHGSFFTLRDAFFLRNQTAEEAGKGAKDAATLVPVAVSTEVGGDGDLLINASEVVRIQALTKDSEIAKALDIKEG